LASHRRSKHGIAGSSVSTLSLKKKKKAGSPTVQSRFNGQFPCTHEGCKFIAKWKGGLTKHMNAHGNKRSLQLAKQTLPPIVSNGAGVNHSNNQEAHVAPDGIAEVTLALALGRFQELCRSMAFEFDIPPKLFTQRLAELIYRAQVR
jgi:hypothetical protein